MASTTTTATTFDPSTAEHALLAEAAAGNDAAFGELYRREATHAWGLALAITGDPADTERVLVDGSATAFTAIRAGRAAGRAFRVTLLTAIRNAAVDLLRERDDRSPRVLPHDADLATVATVFATLPEHWRTTLWLTDVEGLGRGEVGAVLGQGTGEIIALADRATSGFREHYLASAYADCPTTCTRAVERIRADAQGTLDADGVAALERHLDLCETCATAHADVMDPAGRLVLLARPLPTDDTDVKAAWLAVATATAGTSFLSPTAEKILAGVSAFAAVVGVVGAALFGVQDLDGDDDVAAAPIAPLVNEIATPEPIDLAGFTAPVAAARRAGQDPSFPAIAPNTPLAPVSPIQPPEVAPLSPDSVAPTPADLDPVTPSRPSSPTPTPVAPNGVDPADTDGPAVVVPLVPEGAIPAGSLPEVQVDLSDQGLLPIAVDVDDTPGITVGPIQIGSAPEESDSVIEVGGPLAPLAPVVQPVNDLVEGALGGLGLGR